jgi:hypothetical protein
MILVMVLVLTVFCFCQLSMKQCMYIGVRPNMEIQGVEVLTLIGGLCCVGFTNPVGGGVAAVWRQRLYQLGPTE